MGSHVPSDQSCDTYCTGREGARSLTSAETPYPYSEASLLQQDLLEDLKVFLFSRCFFTQKTGNIIPTSTLFVFRVFLHTKNWRRYSKFNTFHFQGVFTHNKLMTLFQHQHFSFSRCFFAQKNLAFISIFKKC